MQNCLPCLCSGAEPAGKEPRRSRQRSARLQELPTEGDADGSSADDMGKPLTSDGRAFLEVLMGGVEPEFQVC